MDGRLLERGLVFLGFGVVVFFFSDLSYSWSEEVVRNYRSGNGNGGKKLVKGNLGIT